MEGLEPVHVHAYGYTIGGFKGAKGPCPNPELGPKKVPGEAMWRFYTVIHNNGNPWFLLHSL